MIINVPLNKIVSINVDIDQPTPTTTPTPPPVEPAPVTRRLFSPESFLNRKLQDSATIHSNSANFVSELVAQTKTPFSAPWINIKEFTTPLFIVKTQIAKKPVKVIAKDGTALTWTRLNEELSKGVPIPADLTASAGTDGHCTIWDWTEDKIYEFWQLKNTASGWQCTWGGIIRDVSNDDGIVNLVTNAAGGAERQGATATSIAVIGGVIMESEVKAGVIPHALGVCIPRPSNKYVWPAINSDGDYTGANAIPEGQRFRFDKTISINPSWPPMMKMMVEAVRDYGLVVKDRGYAVCFYCDYGAESRFKPYWGGLELWDFIKLFPFNQLKALA